MGAGESGQAFWDLLQRTQGIPSLLGLPWERDLTETSAIAEAKGKLGIDEFPDQPGKVKGIIHGGGPMPGIQVPGVFETQAEEDSGNSYTVTFTESWNARDFHYAGQNGPELSHFYKYKVIPNGVQLIDQGGFPPQMEN